jgi:DNA-directed RNA polymerase subunit RPC12/RpoP
MSARYIYVCAGCQGPVSKTPCVKPPEEVKVGKRGEDKKSKKKYDYAGLHGWKCNNCGAGVKITRRMNNE